MKRQSKCMHPKDEKGSVFGQVNQKICIIFLNFIMFGCLSRLGFFKFGVYYTFLHYKNNILFLI